MFCNVYENVKNLYTQDFIISSSLILFRILLYKLKKLIKEYNLLDNKNIKASI